MPVGPCASTSGEGNRRKFCGVVIDAHAHPAMIPSDVIDPMRSHFALLLIFEIVGTHWLRLSFVVPLPPPVLEIPHQFLFLAVHGNHRLMPLLKRLALTIDVLELCVPVRMRDAFAG